MELFALTLDVMRNMAVGLCFLCFAVDMPCSEARLPRVCLYMNECKSIKFGNCFFPHFKLAVLSPCLFQYRFTAQANLYVTEI